MSTLKITDANDIDVYLEVTGAGSDVDPFVPSQNSTITAVSADIDVQNPLPDNTDSVYVSDIDVTNSDNGDFSGSVTDYFDSLKSVNSDTTGNNPKSIMLWFNRTVYSHSIGLGCDDGAKTFGTDVTVKLLGSAEAVRYTKNFTGLDGNSALLDFGPKVFNGVILEFNTATEVALSNITIQKATSSNSTIHGTKDNGEVGEVGVTNRGQFKVSIEEYGDTPAIDAFGSLRVSEKYTLFDSKQLHDKQPLFWDEVIGGSATSVHSSSNAETLMSVTASSSDYVIRQTKQRFNYQPGKSAMILMTLRSPQSTGVTCRTGMFDDDGTGNNLTPNNGMFFECDGTVSWNIAKNGTITETVTQANWNVDKLDGTGASGITLDLTACQILVMDYEWLGVGRVRVGFVVDGLIYYCHYFNHANDDTFTSVYMSTPNLPLRYSIESDGTGGGTLSHICSTVMSEGGVEQTGILRSFDNGTTAVTASTAGVTYAVLGIRLKDAYNDVSVIPEYFNMISTTADDFKWSLCLNPTIAGTFTYSDQTNSAVQLATGATANTVSDVGLQIDSGYTVSGVSGGVTDRKFVTSLRMGSEIDGTLDELVLCVTPLSASAGIYGSLTVRELL